MKRLPVPHHPALTGRAAFTLIELITSVAVVAVLASLLIATLQRVQRSTHNVNCQAHLRGLGQAMAIYITDMDSRVVSRIGGSSRAAGDLWGAELSGRGYLLEPSRQIKHISLSDKDPKITRCPLGKLPDSYNAENWSWYTYGLNMFTPGSTEAVIDKTSLHIREVADADSAKLVLLADSLSGSGGVQTFRIRQGTAEGLELRHNGHGNVLFLDGHIESVDRERALRLGFPAVY